MEALTADNLIHFVSVFAPGLVILGIRQWFVAAPRPKLEERLVAYACVSVVYYTLANPIVSLLPPTSVPTLAVNALEYLFVPGLLGLVWGYATAKDLPDVLWSFLGVQPMHHAPTAWDYAFSRLKKPPFVFVTLMDGSTVAGYYDRGSFAAHLSGERDLLINQLWTCPDGGKWKPLEPERSILICGQNIRTVEFFKEPTNGEQSQADQDH